MNTLGTLGLLVTLFGGAILLTLKRARWIGAAMIIGAATFTVVIVLRESHRHQEISRLVHGAREADVLSAVGPPDRTTDGSEWVEAGFPRTPGESIPGCVREHWYYTFYYPYAQALCFDSKHQLIRITTYSSW